MVDLAAPSSLTFAPRRKRGVVAEFCAQQPVGVVSLAVIVLMMPGSLNTLNEEEMRCLSAFTNTCWRAFRWKSESVCLNRA